MTPPRPTLHATTLTLLAPLLLIGCGTGPAGHPDPTGFNTSIGGAADDSTSFVTVTRTITPAVPATPTTPATPEIVKYSSSEAGPVKFTFTARPGSNAAYITSYKIVRSSLNGVDQGPSDVVVFKNTTYVTSGYACTPLPGNDQSCTFQDPSTLPANGRPSAPISINFAGELTQIARDRNSSVTEDFDIEFYGISANNAPVTVRLNHVIARANFVDN